MLNLKTVVREAKTHFYQSFANHRVPIKLNRAIISFTFDDVPRSAFTNAVPLLDKYGIKATFYVSAGLSNPDNIAKENALDEYLRPDDLVNLNQNNHHLACHTYSHYRLTDGNASKLYQDTQRNIDSLQVILGDVPIEHFSYPFGQVSFEEKRLLAQQYKTMRSSRPGLNAGATDLYLLRATSLYSSSFDKQAIENIIKKAVDLGGWLILYTHGVETNPDAYGCSPEQFEWVLKQCVASGADIQPIDKAYQQIINQPA
ncbi:MAG: polysaccharide deacetylase family protein [Pseudomonadota bacterium]